MCLFEIGWIVGVVYIMFQLIGAILGGLLAWGVFYESIYAAPILDPYRICNTPPDFNTYHDNCAQSPGPGRGFLIELIGTTFIVFVYFMVDLSMFAGNFAWLSMGSTTLGFLF